jgi:hypothetical protein
MITRKPLETSWQALPEIPLAPAVAHLPAAHPAERRDLTARQALLGRIRGEFEEMPGLSVTLDQAARLFGLPRDIASRILERLTEERVLYRRRNAQFARHFEET